MKILPYQLNKKLINHLFNLRGFNILYTPKFFGVKQHLKILNNNFENLVKVNDKANNYYINKSYYIKDYDIGEGDITLNAHVKNKIILDINHNISPDEYKNLTNNLYHISEDYPNNFTIICRDDNHDFIKKFLHKNPGSNMVGDSITGFRNNFILDEKIYILFLHKLADILYNDKFSNIDYDLLIGFDKTKIAILKRLFPNKNELIEFIWKMTLDIRLPQYAIFLISLSCKSDKKNYNIKYNPWSEYLK